MPGNHHHLRDKIYIQKTSFKVLRFNTFLGEEWSSLSFIILGIRRPERVTFAEHNSNGLHIELLLQFLQLKNSYFVSCILIPVLGEDQSEVLLTKMESFSSNNASRLFPPNSVSLLVAEQQFFNVSVNSMP